MKFFRHNPFLRAKVKAQVSDEKTTQLTLREELTETVRRVTPEIEIRAEREKEERFRIEVEVITRVIKTAAKKGCTSHTLNFIPVDKTLEYFQGQGLKATTSTDTFSRTAFCTIYWN